MSDQTFADRVILKLEEYKSRGENFGSGLIKGAHWSRQFTVDQICEWLKTEFKITDNSAANWYAKKIEERFGK